MDIDEANSLISDSSALDEEVNIFIVGDEKIDKIGLIYNLKRLLNVNLKTEKFLGNGIRHFYDTESQEITDQIKYNFVELNVNFINEDKEEIKNLSKDTNILCFIIKNMTNENCSCLETFYDLLSILYFEKVIVVVLDKKEKIIKNKFRNIKNISILNLNLNDITDIELIKNLIELKKSKRRLKRFKKIFKIVKTEKKRKDVINEKIDYIEPSISNPNSLISISKEVFKYLQSNHKTRGNNVTQYILEQLNISHDDMSFKNIQRRVYDAINVMHAIGLLQKDKNTLHYKGDSNFKSLFFTNVNKKQNNILNEKINNKTSNINTKQHELISLFCKFYLSHKLVHNNKLENDRRFTPHKLAYPFNLLKQNSDASLSIKQDDYNMKLCILSDKPLDFISEEEIMKNLLKNDNNIKLNMKFQIDENISNYISRHQLLDKYFNNFANFNSNDSYYDNLPRFGTNLNDDDKIHTNNIFEELNNDIFDCYDVDKLDAYDNRTNQMSTSFFSKIKF